MLRFRSLIALILFHVLLVAGFAQGILVETDFEAFEEQVKNGEFKHHLANDRKIVRITLQGNPFDLPKRVSDSLIILRQQGFVVEGGYLAGPYFDAVVDRARNSDEPAGALLMPLPPEEDGESRRNFLRRGLAALAAPKEAAKSFFGLPNGFTRIQEGVRFLPKKNYLTILLVAEVFHNEILRRKLVSIPNAPRITPHVILGVYLWMYLSNMDEVMRMKGQGGTMVIDSEAEFGRQVSVRPAYTWITAQTTLEEFIINSALRGGIMGTVPSLKALPDTIADSVFSAFAKSFSEKLITQVYALKADALRRNDHAAAARYETWKQALIHGFYNGLFPLLKVMQLPGREQSTRELSNQIQGAMGLMGVGWELFQQSKYRAGHSAPASCSMLIEFEAAKENLDESPIVPEPAFSREAALVTD